MLLKLGVYGINLDYLRPQLWFALSIIQDLWGDEDIIIIKIDDDPFTGTTKSYERQYVEIRRSTYQESNDDIDSHLTPAGYVVTQESDHIRIDYIVKEF